MMKKLKIILLTVIVNLGMNSCKNELTTPLLFDVKTETATTIVNDTVIVKKNTVLNFNFEGNPQFISFFSGEAGKEFLYFNSSVIPESEIDSCFLKFDVTPTGVEGSIENTLSLLISDKFPGLFGGSSAPAYAKDSANVRNINDYNWVDLTLACDFPKTSGTKKSVKLNMLPYLSKNVSLQFKYLTKRNDVDQPKWTIANLKFVRYQKGKAAVEIPAASLAFKPFDIVNQSTAYAVLGAGVWSKSNPANMFINSTLAGNVLNEDFLISTPILLNPLTTASTGDLVKNLSVDVTTYSYAYSTKGIYTATFVATNVNYLDKGQKKIVSFIIKVID